MNYTHQGPLKVVALKDSDSTSLKRSASGGAFAVLARPILERGGIVFGCLWDERGRAVHGGVEAVEDLCRLQGSKYVQSDTTGVYKQVRTALKEGRKVLFSGTPCEVAALYAYLDAAGSGALQANLLTCDVICHGVTSPQLFEAYREWLQEKNGATAPIKSYVFRSKKYGWGGCYYTYSFERRGKTITKGGISDDDPYYSAFLKGDLYRDCCYECPFANLQRPGDFTIGDFWGIKTEHPDFNDPAGVSAMFINSVKGVKYFEQHCANSCSWIGSTVEAVTAHNSNLKAPSAMSDRGPRLRLEVDRAFETHDYNDLFERVLKPNTGLKGLVRKFLPFSAVKKISEVLHGAH